MKINDWEFDDEILNEIWTTLGGLVHSNVRIYPYQENIFKAFELCSFENVKVVILGQDCYHNSINGVPMANGLCFSQGTGNNKATPPSLMNIISEIEIDVYNEPFNVERLELENIDAWGAKQATQGVLLLNTALTVEESKPASHIELWKPFTEAVMRKLSEKDFIVWILWGEYAKKYKEYIPQSHVVIEGVHPSPLSAYRGFFGSRPFSKANKALEENGKPTIVW